MLSVNLALKYLTMIPSFFILPMMAASTAFCSATNSAGRVFYRTKSGIDNR